MTFTEFEGGKKRYRNNRGPSSFAARTPNKSNKRLFIPAQAVQILSMMEDDLSVQEAEVTTLRWDVATLRHGAELREEEHRLEVLGLSSQVEETQGAVVRNMASLGHT
jgi:hypothetical protein